MSDIKIIKADGCRYLSKLKEFKDGIPFGVVNKKITDVGGTFVAANCNSNYIIVVPFKGLADSIEADINNKYDVFKLYGGILKTPFKNYVSDNTIKKFVVTYDSFDKLSDWLESVDEDLSDYKVLIDEYHLTLEDMDFRDEAINKMINTLKRYGYYSFLSATPINTDYEFNFLKELPHYEVVWDDEIKIDPFKIKTPDVYKATSKLIEEYQKGLELNDIDGNITKVEQLHIFMNSVQGIAQVCNTLKLDENSVKIVCADTIRNNIVLNKYRILSITEPNRAINFYTKKGFQGCNIFSNNALIVVVSDAKKEHTLIDIETTMTQIIGRIRFNKNFQNVFRHKVYHIFSTNKNIMNDAEFNEFLNNTRNSSKIIYDDLMSKDKEVRNIFLKRMNFESDLISKEGNNIYWNEMKEQLFRYKYELKKAYQNGLSVRNKYFENKKFNDGVNAYLSCDDILLAKIISVKLEDLYKGFLEAVDKDIYKLEYPEFFDYQEYMTVSEMNTQRWNKEKINKLLSDKKIMRLAHSKVFDRIENGFISNNDVKQLYEEVFKELNIGIKSKSTLILENRFIESKEVYKKIKDKNIRGYEINKLIFHL